MVVMGSGLGANREMGVEKYARRFVDAGMSVLLFDYRHFGASGGEPRQLLDIGRQRADWHAAIACAKSLPDVDADRIALWGTSFGGGHVLPVAADDPTVAAVVAQCPFTNGFASTLAIGPVSAVKAGWLSFADLVGSVFGRAPITVALAGERGDAALMAAHDVVAGYGRLAQESPNHRPKVLARIGLRILFDLPGRSTKRLAMPVLFAVCEKDSVAPKGPTLAAAKRAAHAVVKRYPVGHFEIYFDEPFEAAVKDQTEFLISALNL